jgi:hypothetical protein
MLLSDLLSLRRVKMTNNLDDLTSGTGIALRQPGTVIVLGAPTGPERRARIGVGHASFALAVADEAIQLEWREKLIRAEVACVAGDGSRLL